MNEFFGELLGNLVVAAFLGWILMLCVGSIGLGWGFWPCLGIMFLVVLTANFIRNG